MDVYEIRRARLEQLKQEIGSIVGLAERIKKAPAQISQWLHQRRNITEESAREIESKLRRPRLWMDRLDGGSEPTLFVSEPVATYQNSWPFPVDYARYMLVGAKERKQVEAFMQFVVANWEASHPKEGTPRTA